MQSTVRLRVELEGEAATPRGFNERIVDRDCRALRGPVLSVRVLCNLPQMSPRTKRDEGGSKSLLLKSKETPPLHSRTTVRIVGRTPLQRKKVLKGLTVRSPIV
jgi:hypothetical protein